MSVEPERDLPEREQRVRKEARALWRALSDAPPPADASGDDILSAIFNESPTAPEYDRIRSPFLRASQIARPTNE